MPIISNKKNMSELRSPCRFGCLYGKEHEFKTLRKVKDSRRGIPVGKLYHNIETVSCYPSYR
jgi:hypothetical protein